MNRRKFFIALAIALPLALIIPLGIVRSRQPRVLNLPCRTTNVPGDKDITSFFWRPNGLFLTRSNVPLHLKPLQIKDWSGQTFVVRAAKADEAALDARGETAALIYRRSAKLEHDLWDVEANKSRGVTSKLKGAQRQAHNAFSAWNWEISPDGKRAAWLSLATKSVQIGDARTVKADANFATKITGWGHQALTFSPDSRELAINNDDDLWIVDARSGKLKRQWPLKTGAHYYRGQWSPDGKLLALFWGHPFQNATGATANTPQNLIFLSVFDAQTGARRATWSQTRTLRQPRGVTNASFSPDSKTLAFGTFDGSAHLMNLKSGEIERHFPTPGAQSLADPAHYVAYAPDGNTIAVATQSKILLWRIN